MRHIIIVSLAAALSTAAIVLSICHAQANTIATREAHAQEQIVTNDYGQSYRIVYIDHDLTTGAHVIVSAMTADFTPIFLSFDCRGHISSFRDGYASIPPRSVAAKIAEIACRGAKR